MDIKHRSTNYFCFIYYTRHEKSSQVHCTVCERILHSVLCHWLHILANAVSHPGISCSAIDRRARGGGTSLPGPLINAVVLSMFTQNLHIVHNKHTVSVCIFKIELFAYYTFSCCPSVVLTCINNSLSCWMTLFVHNLFVSTISTVLLFQLNINFFTFTSRPLTVTVFRRVLILW